MTNCEYLVQNLLCFITADYWGHSHQRTSYIWLLSLCWGDWRWYLQRAAGY